MGQRFNSLLLFLFPLVMTGCSLMMLDPLPADTTPSDILLVVEQSRFSALSSPLEQYAMDINSEGGSVEIVSFPAEGSASSLREMIAVRGDTINGAFLVGTLPAPRYEQTAFGKYEEFPIDLYYMDPDAVWMDSDKNGKFDSHSELELSHYLSRINGTDIEIVSYFSKLHAYRVGNSPFLGGAYIFKDEDWFDTYRSSSFGLNRIYNSIRIDETPTETLRGNYLQQVAHEGADYVYQWIHATPTSLYISDGSSYTTFRYNEIEQYNAKGRFFNMFNCKGARFTQINLAMTYLTGTDTGLAVTGSTKVGGNYYPLEFHRTLAAGSSWGNAFKSWYNYYGKSDDSWFLGMVILGDPALKIQDMTADRALSRGAFDQIIPPDRETVSRIAGQLTLFDSLDFE